MDLTKLRKREPTVTVITKDGMLITIPMKAYMEAVRNNRNILEEEENSDGNRK